jgi:hypothetical protein
VHFVQTSAVVIYSYHMRDFHFSFSPRIPPFFSLSDLTDFMSQGLPWKRRSCSDDGKIPCFYGTRRFIGVLAKSQKHNLPRDSCIQASELEKQGVKCGPSILPSMPRYPKYNRSNIPTNQAYKYYASGHYTLSCFYLKHCPVYVSKHSISETGFCLRLQVKPYWVGPNL